MHLIVLVQQLTDEHAKHYSDIVYLVHKLNVNQFNIQFCF